MSSKNVRYNKIFCGNLKESTPKTLRQQIASKQLLNKSSVTKNENNKSQNNGSILNIGFSQPVCNNKTPVSAKNNQFKGSSTTLNACYTPSSLYNNSTGSTPTSLRGKYTTPKNVLAKLSSGSDPKTPDCFSKVSIETPRRSAKSHNEEGTTSGADCEISNLSVAVRVRPMNAKECLKASAVNIVQVNENEVTVLVGTSADSSAGVSHSFQYDHAFWSCNSEDLHFADQDKVFKSTALHLIDKGFEGYNACLFAYGQTGSGKSYSMMGVEAGDNEEIGSNSEAGIIPRFCKEIFRRVELLKDQVQTEIEVSYFEIYNEKIHDLLCVSQAMNNACDVNKRNALRVREHPVWGPYVVDLSTHPVDSYSSLRNWLTVGNSQRATAATGMNDKSSRSHSIFNIVLNLSEKHDSSSTRNIKHTKRSKISLVDLAGSERISHTCTSGERLREGVSINKSLLTLGKVIAALADTKKISFVPYRESVLTWLLRESLGGNSKTVMLATISPASIHMDETLATLRYACQARTIVNRVKVNEDKHDRIIRELRAEVERLQALRQDYERQKRHSASAPPRKIIIETSVDESEIETLRLQLAETEKELVKAQTSWMERLNVAEDLRKSEMRMLKRKGLAMELSVEQKQACLVNLAADPILSNTLFYILPPGVVRIGRSRPPAFVQPDIVLEGPLVAFHHCSIENVKGKLFVIPESTEFETFLNGELLQNKQQIYHGDRLVIGGSHYFRISNPTCSKRHKQIIVDFQLAHQEILQKQEKQLRKELEDEKHAALAQIEEERAANERNYKEQIEFLELEKFKYKCSKELLETEKQIIDQKGQEEAFEYTPFKSTLLDNIEKIMQHPSEASLHKTQLMVKEATQRCRDVGINLEFKQAQVLDKFGIFRAVVEILDKDNLRKADWPTARLDVWLDIVRENNIIVNDPFQSVDIEWKPVGDCSDTLSDSLNSSRISLNLSTVKEAVLKKPPNCALEKIENVYNSPQSGMKQPTRNTVLLNSSSNKKIQTTKKMLTYDDDLTPRESLSPNINSSDFSSAACVYLKEIQRSTLKLKKFCDKYIPDENSNQRQPLVDYVSKSIGELEGIVQDVRNKLMESNLSGTSPRTAKSVRFILD